MGRIEAARYALLRALQLQPDSAEAAITLSTLPPRPPMREDFAIGAELRSNSRSNVTYRILEVRKGGFGAVYIASTLDGKMCALKTLQSRYLWSDEDRARFEREALIWIELGSHLNVVQARNLDRVEGVLCLELEYIAGGDLQAHISQRGYIAEREAVTFALSFCDGMLYAHNKLQIVHRDIKPSNCLLDKESILKVTDFGLARTFAQIELNALGLSDIALVNPDYTLPMGTRSYMAPEQFCAEARLDTRTDIYSFGVMLYQLLTGCLPLTGNIAQEFMRACNHEHSISDHLLKVIMQCVEPERQNRPGSFAEVRAMLEPTNGLPPAVSSGAHLSPTTLQQLDDLHARGCALMVLGGHHEEALACFEQCLQFDPNDATIFGNYALALLDIGRFNQALEHLEKSLSIDPSSLAMMRNKGLVLRKMGRIDDAIILYKQILENDPDDLMTMVNLGTAFLSVGRCQEAILLYTHGLRIDVRNFALWANLGNAYRTTQQYEDALQCCEMSLAINPQDSVSWDCQAEVLVRLHRKDEALLAWSRAIECAPEDAWLWMKKGELLEAMGKTAEANPCFERFADISVKQDKLHVRKSD